MEDYDVIIIGGGVVGAAIAHKLAEYELNVVLLEKESDLASGTSKANSGIFHAPYNVNPETLKGKLHLRAMEIGPKLMNNLHVPFKQIGALVVAYSSTEVAKLENLYVQIQKLNLPAISWLNQEQVMDLEPEINNKACAALWAKQAGIISPYEFTFALGENAILNGVRIYLDSEVIGLREQESRMEVLTTERIFQGKVVVNAAGLHSDKVGTLVGDYEFTITPRRGEYYLFDRNCGNIINHILFSVPTEVSKGILVTPTVDGNLLVGPNAEEITSREDRQTTRKGLEEVMLGGERIISNLQKGEVINLFAGLRSVIKETEDFFIRTSANCKRLIHVAGIQSPGLTAAPAIGEYVVQLIGEMDGIILRPKKSFGYYRKPVIRFSDLSREEQARLIDQDARYGQIICRCEQVTEAEVVDALTRPLPARTLGGIKRRVRAGMGRCQGGFCGSKIMDLIAKYSNLSKLEITKEGGNSYILSGVTKGQ